MANTPLLICMVGLPRSGKSTIARGLAKQYGAPIVNQDAIRLALHGQRYAGEAEPMVKTMARYMIEALFGAGHEIVICDETNYSKAARDSRRSAAWRTKFCVVNTDHTICKQRAFTTRQEDLIPVIDEMVARWEPLTEEDETIVLG